MKNSFQTVRLGHAVGLHQRTNQHNKRDSESSHSYPIRCSVSLDAWSIHSDLLVRPDRAWLFRRPAAGIVDPGFLLSGDSVLPTLFDLMGTSAKPCRQLWTSFVGDSRA